ncbi:MAG: LysM domain-containing protein [Planctomycetota bacterium]
MRLRVPGFHWLLLPAALWLLPACRGTPPADTPVPVRAGAEETAPLLYHAAPPRLHRVRPGDTLQAIARRHGIAVETILELNPDLDARTLRVGGVIQLPPGKPIFRRIDEGGPGTPVPAAGDGGMP